MFRSLKTRIEDLEQAIIVLDDSLCDIASGDQGAFIPHPSTVSACNNAIDYCRTILPLEDRSEK